MKTTVNNSYFHDAFRHAGRLENFSYAALNLLFEYFEEIESDTGEEIELDVIAICCEYEETSAEDVIKNYSLDEELSADEVIAWLSNQTQYIGASDRGLIFASF